MENYFYHALPFVRLLMPFLIGRTFSIFFPINLIAFIIMLLGAILITVFLASKFTWKYSGRWKMGFWIYLVLFLSGYCIKPHSSFSNQVLNQECFIKAKVNDVIKADNKKQSLLLDCYVNDEKQRLFFQALAYVNRDSSNSMFVPGDRIGFKSKLLPLQRTGNPFSFEYADYMRIRGVKGQFFLKQNEYLLLQSGFSLQRNFYKIKIWAKGKLGLLNLGTQEFGIVSALVLGDKSLLAYDTKANFSNSGAIHVLSVSGLHVGILYLLLVSVLGKVRKGWLSTLKVMLILIVLWFYAAITGMSPSVTRATIMFTVFLIARWQNQFYNVYHSLAIAAFIIILIHPYSIVNAGFWLSFFAVASIVYFYPKINSLLYFQTPWNRYVWALISVSIAAQIGTFPLGIYLFGYLPSWFILANLLIVPVLPFALIGSLMVIIVPFNSIPSQLIAGVLKETIVYMKEITGWLGGLPYALFTNIQLVFYEMVILYLFLIYWVIWKQMKLGKYLIYSLVFLFLTIVFVTGKTIKKANEEIFAVHQIKSKTAISYSTKNNSTCLIRTPLSAKEIYQSVNPLWLTQESDLKDIITIEEKALYPVSLSDLSVLIINKDLDQSNQIVSDLNPNAIVFTTSVSMSTIREFNMFFKDQIFVFDSSLSTRKSKYVQKELGRHRKLAHFVTLDGAYVIHR